MIGGGLRRCFLSRLCPGRTTTSRIRLARRSTSLPAVIFLHVFLAFPNGRLQVRFEKVLVAAAYATAIGLQLVRMLIGEYGPHNLLEVSTSIRRAHRRASTFSFSSISALLLGRTRNPRRATAARRPAAAPSACAAHRLVRARAPHDRVLFFSRCLRSAGVPSPIQRATLLVIGLSPVVFLIGLLDARLARSAVGDLFVELRADPSPARSARRARAGPSRSVVDSRLLAARVRELGGPRRSTALSCPNRREWQSDDADRPRRCPSRGACSTIGLSTTSPSCSPRSVRRLESRSRTPSAG